MITQLTPQQIATLQAAGLAPQGQQPTQAAVPFSVVANPNQFAQPYAQQAPAAQPAQPAQNQQPDARFAQLNQRIPAAPNIPAAFHNRSIQEILDGFAKTAGTLQQIQRQQVQAPAQGQQPQAPQQFSQQPQQNQQPIQTPSGMTLEQIQQTIEATLAKQQLPQLVLQTEAAVAQQNPAYGNPAIRTRVQEIISTLPQEQQAQRAMWDYAITLAVGEQVQKGGMAGFAQPTVRQDAPYVPGAQRAADNYLNGTPATFVEAPTGQANYAQGQRPPMTQAEAQLATQLGLNPNDVSQHNQKAFGFA